MTCYIHLPYEFLADSVLTRFKSDNKYFESRVKRDGYQDGIDVYRFIYDYAFKMVEGDTGHVLFKSPKKIRFNTDQIKAIQYHDAIVFNCFGTIGKNNVTEADFKWLATSPVKVYSHTLGECFHEYFILHEKNIPEIESILSELLNMDAIDDPRREVLESKLSKYKVVVIKRLPCL